MKKPRGILLGLLLLAAAYFALLGGEHSLFDLWRIERQTRHEVARLDSVRAEIAPLRARVDSLQSSPATLERLARERYGLIRDGERLYRFAEPGASAGAAEDGVPAADPAGR